MIGFRCQCAALCVHTVLLKLQPVMGTLCFNNSYGSGVGYGRISAWHDEFTFNPI